jgi:hypothetical protein
MEAPMKANGILFLSRTKPIVRKTSHGEFMLTLCTVNRIATHQTEAYRLVWTGEQAEAFYNAQKDNLIPGAVLHVDLYDIRTHTIAIGQNELTAKVCTIHLEQHMEAA